MEHLENKIIREKLESLDKLPTNYEIDLASKFDLVMQANQPKKKNYLLWLAVPTSIAASFILFLIFGNSQISTSNTALKIQLNQKSNFEELKATNQLAIGYPVKIRAKKAPVSTKKQEVKIVSNPALQEPKLKEIQLAKNDSIVPEVQIASVNINKKQKKSRFRELDFNEQVVPVNLASELKKEPGFIRFKFPDGVSVNSIQPEKVLSYRQSF